MVFSKISLKALVALTPFLSLVNGHMIMKTPIPYGRGSIDSAPLETSGSNFPCKNIFTLTDEVKDVNHMAIGEEQTLSFTGSAVHGGGSCQIALAKTTTPNKSTTWMVIKSIEGGCPSSAAGNLPADPNGSGADSFKYTIPEGISPGTYTIAWTWQNKIGNREFYMNCGRAEISAPKKKRYAPAPPKTDLTKRADFPDIFVANLAINTCVAPEGIDLVYPNGGASVVQGAGAKLQKAEACTGPYSGSGSTAADDSSSNSGSGSGSSSAAASSAAATSSAAAGAGSGQSATTSATESAATVNPGVFASGAASQSAAAPESSAAAATTSAAAAAATTATSSSSSSSNSNTGAGATGSCTEGDWMCAADGKSFQRCASGGWSTSIAMASGMTCTPGESANIDMKAIAPGSKRSLGSPVRRSSLSSRRRALPVPNAE